MTSDEGVKEEEELQVGGGALNERAVCGEVKVRRGEGCVRWLWNGGIVSGREVR